MPKRFYNLTLKGFVGSADFNPKAVDNVLGSLDGQKVDVLIDSTGGQLSTALSISDAFSNHGNVHVHFVGMNASAATIASMGAAHISIDRSAMYLVHKGSLSFFQWGSLNADELEDVIKQYQKAKADLDKIDLNIAALYASRCKRDPKDLLELMKTGAWLTAQEALEWGFVDEITDFEEDMPATLSQATAHALSGQGLPLPNMPVISDFWQSVMSRLESIFKSCFTNNNSVANSMKRVFANICKALGCDALEFADNETKLSLSQIEAVEAAIKDANDKSAQLQKQCDEKDEEIKKIKAQLDELSKKPAEDSTSVVEDSGKKSEESLSAHEAFISTGASAMKLFNSLP